MECVKCGYENPAEMNFCGKCGSTLTHTASVADKADSLRQEIATHRNSRKLGTNNVTVQKDRIEPERRRVTVMFCDMKDYTQLTHELGAAETFAIRGKILDIMIHDIQQYGGTVHEVLGDGILALFGAPEALEDGPPRAIRASIAIHKNVAEFNNTLSQTPPILLRIGITTGTVVAGTVGIDLGFQFTLVGDTINMASRVESLAVPGTTYVTEETYQLTKELFHFQPLGKKFVKGKEEPIFVYRVISAKEDVYRPRLGSERMIYSEMMGRDSELNRLELQVITAINGQGSVVNIIGDAGIGKSRMVAELRKRDVINRVILLEGRAISFGKNLRFHPIIDLAKQWVGIRSDDGEVASFLKLQAAVRMLFPDDYGEVLPFLAILMGIELTGDLARRVEGIEGEALKRLIVRSIEDVLTKAAETTPLVIIMEDLHWADESTIELLESVFRLARTQRIVFINVFRPDYKETGERMTQTVRERHPNYYMEMVLQPLSEKSSEVLISGMLGSIQPGLVTSIVERTGGNPFFIEEIIRSLLDEEALVPMEGKFQVTREAATLSIPNTIEALLTARIDRLKEQTREVLRIASVIGRSFFRRILEEVASNIDGINESLTYLKEIQLLHERRRLGELEYVFKHGLIQEVAYESILPSRRKEVHLSIARAIEKIFSERLHECYGMLAYHYGKAESLEEAEECLIKAGEEALRSSASNEALRYYQEALVIYERLQGENVEPAKLAMLQKNIGLALFNRGQYTEAVEHFDKALNYYWGTLPKTSVSKTLRLLSSVTTFLLALYLPSRYFKKRPSQRDIEAVELYYKKAEALVIINPKRFVSEFFFFHATAVRFEPSRFKLGIAIFAGASTLFSFGGLSLNTARRIADYAKPRLDRDDARQSIIYDLVDTQHLFLKGEWNQIAECDQNLVRRILRLGETFWASGYYYWKGLPQIYQGHFDTTRLFVAKLGEIAETYDNDASRLLKYLLNMQLLIECRQIEEARAEVNRGIDLVVRKTWPQSELSMQSLKASIHLLMKETEEAGRALDRAQQIRSKVRAVPIQLSFLLRTQFEYDLRRLEEALCNGQMGESSEYRRNAFKSGKMLIDKCQKAALFKTEAYRLMGVYNWLIDDQKGAFRWWQKAISEGTRLGARAHLARTFAEIGTRCCVSNGPSSEINAGNGKESLQKAKSMFTDLGLEYDLKDMSLPIDRLSL